MRYLRQPVHAVLGPHAPNRRRSIKHIDAVDMARPMGLITHHDDLDEQNDAALADEAPTPEEAVLIDEEEHRLAVRGQVVREAVAQLAPKQRDTMQLLLDGHTWAGAGKKLGVAPSAVGSRYKTAVKALRAMLPDMLEHAQVA